ncbi:MAG: hypothetical protein RIT81_25730 [Deltaproteobacteria bacterium]
MSRRALFGLLVIASTSAACGGRGVPKFLRNDNTGGDAGIVVAIRDSGVGGVIRDGGPVGVRDSGVVVVRDAGPAGPLCGNGICDRAQGEDLVNCAPDCPLDPNRCFDGMEGCACTSSFDGNALARDDCDASLLCAPWDLLSGRQGELTGPVQSCVRPCNSDGDCGIGRRCTAAYAELADFGVPRICVDQLAADDQYCGAGRQTRSRLPGARVRTGVNMVGCETGSTCVQFLLEDVHPDEGACLQLCGPGQPACPATLPYCNPILADGAGVCSVGRLGSGSWCAANPDDGPGLTRRCDRNADGDVFCVLIGAQDEGLCMEICNAQTPCRSQSATNPYYCEEGLLQNGDGICMSGNCNNFPDTCGEPGPLGTGRVCAQFLEDAGLCVDRRTPLLAPTGLGNDENINQQGGNCGQSDFGFAQCPDGTTCVPAGNGGQAVCLAGCSVGDAGFCGGLLMSLGLPSNGARCVDVTMDPNAGGICLGD